MGPLAIDYFFFQKYLLMRKRTLGLFLTVFAIETFDFHGNNPEKSDFDKFTATISKRDGELVVNEKSLLHCRRIRYILLASGNGSDDVYNSYR